MASHVVVMDSGARRVTIKTMPSTYLNDVLQQACTKMGLNPSQYGLKNNNKPIDLSRTFRLSGLSSGAKLELVLLSRSPSVVSVALQLPESEASGVPNARLTDKFVSTETLWLILRKFESGVVGSASVKNFTARGVPQIGSRDTGAGRLYYETPVLQIMGREFSSFTDLQKSLAQLGLNSGSVLLRLSFKVTETPLEEAMEQIGRYFKSVEGEASTSAGAYAGRVANAESRPAVDQPAVPEETEKAEAPVEDSVSQEPTSPSEVVLSAASETPGANTSVPEPPLTNPASPGQRAITVFTAPTDVPQAARQAFDERDYEPTVDHAKLHQQRLTSTTRNRRLDTDAEIAVKQETQAQKLADVKEIQIKIRFPDRLEALATFSNLDTAKVLYDEVRRMLTYELEPFLLKFAAAGGPKTIPRDGTEKLIAKLGMTRNTLVNLVWDEGASAEARSGVSMKEELRQKAKPIEVKEIAGLDIADESPRDKPQAPAAEKPGGIGKGKGGVPKWLKLPGKK
ncbi:MAG: hypothetical protein MMC33_006424 [Icmadophila ericetorum]|nr:hypothetical protein [Icmadophila ericetorum]